MRFDIEPVVEQGSRKEALPNWIRRCEGDCEGKRERKNNGESEAVVKITVRCCVLMHIVAG